MFNQKSDSITDLLSEARQEPPRISKEEELPTLFGPPPSHNPMIAKELKDYNPARTVRVVSFVATYVLWRPWNKCKRCLSSFDTGELRLPSIGDWTCPHVQVAEYKEAKDRTLRGEALKEHDEHFMLPDGTRCVQFSWLETDPEYLKEMKEKAEKDEKSAIYPPNPEKVFNEKLEDKEEAEKPTDAAPSPD
jgi:hypothetical protein